MRFFVFFFCFGCRRRRLPPPPAYLPACLPACSRTQAVAQQLLAARPAPAAVGRGALLCASAAIPVFGPLPAVSRNPAPLQPSPQPDPPSLPSNNITNKQHRTKRSRVCGNGGGIIRKYGLNVCRQCFREYAKDIGFVKYK